MIMRKLSLSLVLLGILSSEALALTTAELRDDCSAEARLNARKPLAGDGVLAGICAGYIQGVLETAPTQTFCPPNPTPPGISVGAVKNFLLEHPNENEGIAANTVIKALSAAYPCAKQKEKSFDPFEP